MVHRKVQNEIKYFFQKKNKKVQEARKKKARRLKQAKEEALIEIERFRNERENAFREYESKHMGSM